MTEQTVTTPTAIWSRPEGERTGTPLLVLLHGYGADEKDLFGLTPSLPQDFTVASVRASEAAGPGYAWFPLSSDVSFSLQAVKDATTHLAGWIDDVRGPHSSVTLLGFSQGMCMATSLLRHRPADFAAAVGLSGFAVDVNRTNDADNSDNFFDDESLARRNLPMFWGRDQDDPVIPAQAIEFTNTWLRAHTNLTKVLYSNMLHGINAQELAHVSEFLRYTVLK